MSELCSSLQNGEEKKISERDLLSAEEYLNSLSYEPLTFRTGPVTSGLDRILDKYYITPQCYQSRSFIGNHCHVYIIAEVHKELTSYIVKKNKGMHMQATHSRHGICFNGKVY